MKNSNAAAAAQSPEEMIFLLGAQSAATAGSRADWNEPRRCMGPGQNRKQHWAREPVQHFAPTFGPEPIQILELSGSQQRQADLAADRDAKRKKYMERVTEAKNLEKTLLRYQMNKWTDNLWKPTLGQLYFDHAPCHVLVAYDSFGGQTDR